MGFVRVKGEKFMRRKILAGLLAGIMVVGTLAGCGGGGEEAASSGGEESTEAAADSGEAEASAEGDTDLGTVTLILSNRDEFLSTLEVGVQNAAADMGVEMVTQDAQNDTSKLLQFVETARNAGQKAIIVNPVDPATCSQIIEAAGDMKVVFINRFPNGR
jgi:inositol transport system substrate-binding protein